MIEQLGLKHIESREQAKHFLTSILDGEHIDEALCAFLGELRNLAFSEELIIGFRQAMMERSTPVDIGTIRAIDICGTGGDGKNTFNISTLAALTIAACGNPVVKHGNSAFSSSCGSSDILQRVGIPVPTTPEGVKMQLESHGISFLHAPYFHPMVKRIGAARRKVQFRTIFNILGPLCNPTNPPVKVLGVSHFALARLYRSILAHESASYAVIWDEAGYDEITLTGRAFLTINGKEKVLEPQECTSLTILPEHLNGAASEIADQQFLQIAAGRGTEEQLAVVAVNAAVALHTGDVKRSLKEGFETALETLRNGKVLALIERMKGTKV